RTDVALFLDGREGKRFCLNFYVYGIKDSGQRSEADGFFAKVTGNSDLIRKIDKSWDESKDTIRCYKQELPSYGVEQLKKYVLEKLQQLRCFEDLRRSKK